MLIIMNTASAEATGIVALLAVTAWRVLPAITRILGSVTNIRNSLPFIDTFLDYLRNIEEHDDIEARLVEAATPGQFEFER